MKMSLSKIFKVSSVLYFILLAAMLVIREAGRYRLPRNVKMTPTYLTNDPTQIVRDTDRRGRVAQGRVDHLWNIVIIGYGFHHKHRFPIHCDCEGMKFRLTNQSGEVGDADIVIFTVGARRNMSLDDWRRYNADRAPSQIWVLGSRESPQTCTTLLPPADMEGIYNWSFTYHSKADFPTPYGWFRRFATPRPAANATNWFATKSRLITWTSSDCPLPKNKYQRRSFVAALGKHLNVTMHGTCGDGRYLSRRDYIRTSQEHKFVLALENSCCSEYISEKFWNALTLYGQVPVVYGATRAEYERIAPPGSFIFVQDFTSLRALANYIKRIGASESEYNRYHAWRRLGYTEKQDITEDRVYRCKSVCRIAEKLRGAEHRQGKKYSFDEKGQVWHGGCRACQEEVDVLLKGGD